MKKVAEAPTPAEAAVATLPEPNGQHTDTNGHAAESNGHLVEDGAHGHFPDGYTVAPGDLRILLNALQQMSAGDFSVRLPGDWTGL